MFYFRSVISVLSAPFLYGMFCVPLVSMALAMYPELLNELGGTVDVALTLKIEVLQLLMLGLIGFIVAAIAPVKPMAHTAVAVVLMLCVGVPVQVMSWEAVLVWHHFVFFACIVFGMLAGGMIKARLGMR